MAKPADAPLASSEVQQRIGAAIRRSREARGLTQAALGKMVGLSRSEMNKIEFGQRRVKDVMGTRIAEALGTSFDALIREALGSDSEAEPVIEDKASAIAPAVAQLLYRSGRAETFVVRAASLLLEGISPGDRILVDRTASPRVGDHIVVAIKDPETGRVRTVLRCYQPPVLMPAAVDRRFQPFILDADNIEIVGVIKGQYRPSGENGAA